MIDKKKIETAVAMLLDGIGEDITREGLIETPKRVANMYEELFCDTDEKAGEYLKKTFTVNNSNIVIEKDISFYSMCEHHLMPFYGKVHIAYVPDGKVVGLSKLARTVEVYAKKLQIQEQLTNQLAESIMQYLNPKGVMVIIEAEHMCMTMRGIKKPGTQIITMAYKGEFETNKELRDLLINVVHL